MTLRVKRIAIRIAYSKVLCIYILIMTHIWHHPSYYKRLAEIKREEERKERKKKPLTSKSQSDIVIKHKRNTSAIA